MRLCKPSLQVDTQTRLDLALDLGSDADAVAAISSGELPARPSDRTNLSDSLDAFGEPCSFLSVMGTAYTYGSACQLSSQLDARRGRPAGASRGFWNHIPGRNFLLIHIAGKLQRRKCSQRHCQGAAWLRNACCCLGVFSWLPNANKLSWDARRSCKPTGKRPRCMTTAPRHSPALHQGNDTTSSSGRALRYPF